MSRPVRLGRPRAGDSLATRVRILEAARRTFAGNGYDATTNKAIATEAGITTGALYHYFESKFDLYVAVHEAVQGLVYERFENAIDAAPESFIGRLEAVLDAAHELNRLDPSLARFLGTVRVDMWRFPEIAAVLGPRARRRARFYDDIVEFGVRTGEIDVDDADRVKSLVRTMLTGLNDAVSNDLERHRLAIEGLKALLEGKLIHPIARR